MKLKKTIATGLTALVLCNTFNPIILAKEIERDILS